MTRWKLSVRLAGFLRKHGFPRLCATVIFYWRVKNFLLLDVWWPIRFRIYDKPKWKIRKLFWSCKRHCYPIMKVAGMSLCFLCEMEAAGRRRLVREISGKGL